MKHISFLLITFFLGFTHLQAQNHIRGNGNVTKENRSVGSFDAIDIGGEVNVFLTQGNSNSIEIEADENLHKYIVTEVHGSKLTIKNEKDIKDAKALNVYIEFKEINELHGGGATDIVAYTAISTSNNFDLSASGAVDIELKKGLKCGDLNVGSSGASDLYIKNLVAKKVDAHASGSSDLEMDGTANSIALSASGSSDISAKNLVVKTANISASGSSDIYINVTESIIAEASGSSDIYYSGNPEIQRIKTGAAADIVKQ
ncbi:head GIN domain-containing protein [Chondrinema litorale]|uniref:head GIN domain-containing protein n=1 Tax=Chondrinema litorale TaxID=2994555 RepID=UPI0025438C75|nr:head GIN domain-containing protein [Chondrinema litorale]UZR94448.1 DUF2807 domain-containing protein [Chondrinema litorale]